MKDNVIKFLKSKDYVFLDELGKGACGRTVKLKDEVIDEVFVCKKYEPFDDALKDELFSKFIQEIKLLYLLNHRNVVRVFNYYICLLYTSDAADEGLGVDLGGRRIIK